MAGEFTDTNNEADCQAWADCAVGFYVSAAGTISSDRQCTPCPNGQTTDMINANMGDCRDPDRRRRRREVDGNNCTVGEQYFDGNDCQTYTTCVAGEFYGNTGTPTSDRDCMACGDNTFSSAANSMSCEDHRVCQPGQEVTVEPTATSNRECADCPVDTFSAETNSADCTDRRDCAKGSFVANVPVPSDEDRDCEACTAGTFSDEANAAACDTHVVDCTAGSAVALEPSPTSDRTCTPCVQGTSYSDAPNAAECKDVTTCPSGQGQTASPTLTSNRQCAACVGDTYSATSSQTGPCVDRTVCQPGEAVKDDGSASANRECEACTSGTFSTSENAAECQTWTACDAETEYEVTPGTPSTNRVCAALSPCRADFFRELVPATATTDRVCVNLRGGAVTVNVRIETPTGFINEAEENLREAVGADGQGPLLAALKSNGHEAVYTDTHILLLDPAAAEDDNPDDGHVFIYFTITVPATEEVFERQVCFWRSAWESAVPFFNQSSIYSLARQLVRLSASSPHTPRYRVILFIDSPRPSHLALSLPASPSPCPFRRSALTQLPLSLPKTHTAPAPSRCACGAL
jgi:hypothetical protein